MLLEKELSKGINNLSYYADFNKKAMQLKHTFTEFILHKKLEGRKIAGYGAAAKGNTFLNSCGLKHSEIDFVVDSNPHKQNKWLPASHIPVVSEAFLESEKPDYIVILPWNLKDEITQKLSYVKGWGGKFVIGIPVLEVIETLGIII